MLRTLETVVMDQSKTYQKCVVYINDFGMKQCHLAVFQALCKHSYSGESFLYQIQESDPA